MFKTVAYADIFDYPLTASEIIRWQIAGDLKVRPIKESAAGAIYPQGGSDLIVKTSRYFHLKGRSHLVALRRRRAQISAAKLRLARRVAGWLKLIPTVRLVAVTGALAMKNADKNDDIDLMVVTSKNRLWLTRLLATILLFPHLRGGRMDSSEVADKLCLNLWLDESALAVPASRRNLYTAHEVAQVKPLINKDGTYQKFIASNSWVTRFLPNSFRLQRSDLNRNSRLQAEKVPPKSHRGRSDLIDWLESFAFRLQLWYMKPKITRERVGPHQAFFHPRPTGQIVMKKYRQRLSRLSRSDLNRNSRPPAEKGSPAGERSDLIGKERGKVLATGVFDILHPEHVKFLKAAKKQGDILLVGVESDTRVSLLKGPGRPINPISRRLINLRRLKIADQVFALPEKFFSPAAHEALIKKIRPDILAVSASTPNQKEKRRIMEKLGGRLKVVLPHNPRVSTSKMLQSIK